MYPQISRRIFAALLPAAFTLISTAAYANDPPKAVASVGGDPVSGEVLHFKTLYVGPANTTGIIYTVSGSGSSDPDGDTLRYFWQCTDDNGNTCSGLGLLADTDVRAAFFPGTYNFTLTVTDPSGASSSDSARLKVLVDNNPPTVTPPDDESVSATEGGGARGADSSKLHDFLRGATATDNSTTVSFTNLPPQISGVDVDDSTLLPHGTTTVTFRIADVFGNIGTATADVSVTDHDSGDLFVGVRSLGATQFKGAIRRIRGGAVTDYCVSPDPTFAPVPSGVPVFWNRPDQIVVDSKGRVAFLAPLNYGSPLQPSPQNGWGLLRCNRPGEPAEQLGVFPQGSYIDPGWFEPLPGKLFYPPGLPPTQPLTGLHLRKVKYIRIDDDVNGGNPEIVTDERYVFAYHRIVDSRQHCRNHRQPECERELTQLGTQRSGRGRGRDRAPTPAEPAPRNVLPLQDGDACRSWASRPSRRPSRRRTVTRFGTLRRIHQPLEVQLTTGGLQIGVPGIQRRDDDARRDRHRWTGCR